MGDPHEAQMPIDLVTRQGSTMVVSARLPQTYLTDPFLLDSLSSTFKLADVDMQTPEEQSVLVRPLHYDEHDPRISTMPFAEFIEANAQSRIKEEELKFIFHMSRCGSTLATQMIATSSRFFVASEPPIVNAILNPALQIPLEQKMNLFGSVASAINACRPAGAEQTVIKLRSWNSLFMSEILDTFPRTNWMFVHRNGVEVLESVLRNPPGWLRSKDSEAEFFGSVLGLSAESVRSLSDPEYAAQLLGKFCKNAAEKSSERCEYVDYASIPTELPAVLQRAWGTELTTEEREGMKARTQFYSKDVRQSQEFTPDSELKRQSVSAADRAFAEQYVEAERARLFSRRAEWNREFTTFR